MGLTSTIAELMLEKGRAQAAGQLGAANAYASALQNIGQNVGATIASLPQQQEAAAERADMQRARDARKEFGDAMRNTPMINIGGGVQGYDVGSIGKWMGQKGYGPEFAVASQHLDALNKSFMDFQASRMKTLQTAAEGMAASNYDPTLAEHFFDVADSNGLYPKDTIAEWRQHVKDNPDALKGIVNYIRGPQKPIILKPGEKGFTEAGEAIPGMEGNPETVEINGQLVNKQTGEPIGQAIPKQTTPLPAEEAALKLKQIEEINAKLNGTEKMSAYQRARLVIEQNKLKEEIRNHSMQQTAANPLAAILGSGAMGGNVQTLGANPQSVVQGVEVGKEQPLPQDMAGVSSLTGQALLDKLPQGVANQIKAYAEGRLQFPGGFALRSPYFQTMLNMVGQYDPSFDAVNYNARAHTRQAFTSGAESKTINALNTVVQHLDRLSNAADALKNSWTPAYNSVANFLSKQTGSKVVTNFETTKKAVTDELTRAWRQQGGSEADIKSWAQVLEAANSPEQLHGAIAEMGQLLEGKLSALGSQYGQGMGTAPVDIVTKEARQTLTNLENRAGGQSKTLSVDKVKQIAAMMGKTYAEAKADAESKGFIVR